MMEKHMEKGEEFQKNIEYVLKLINRIHLYFDESEYDLYLNKSDQFVRLLKVIQFNNMKIKQLCQKKIETLLQIQKEFELIESKAVESVKNYVGKEKKKTEKKKETSNFLSYEKEKKMFLESSFNPLETLDLDLQSVIDSAAVKETSKKKKRKTVADSLLKKRRADRKRLQESGSDSGEAYFNIKENKDENSNRKRAVSRGRVKIHHRKKKRVLSDNEKGGSEGKNDGFMEDEGSENRGVGFGIGVKRKKKKSERKKRLQNRREGQKTKKPEKKKKKAVEKEKKILEDDDDKFDVKKLFENWKMKNIEKDFEVDEKEMLEEKKIVSEKKQNLTKIFDENSSPEREIETLIPEFITRNEKGNSGVPKFKPIQKIPQMKLPVKKPNEDKLPIVEAKELIELEQFMLNGNIQIPQLTKSFSLPSKLEKQLPKKPPLTDKDIKNAKTKLNMVLRDKFKLKRRDLDNFSNDIMVKFANRVYFKDGERENFFNNFDQILEHFNSISNEESDACHNNLKRILCSKIERLEKERKNFSISKF